MPSDRVTVKELRSELLERGAYPYEVAIDVLLSRINWITPSAGEAYINRATANAYMSKFLSNPQNTTQGRRDAENQRLTEKKASFRGNPFSERQATLTWGDYIEEKRAIVYKKWKNFSRKRKGPTMTWQEWNEENERLYQEYREVSNEQHDVPRDWKKKEQLRLGYQQLKVGIKSCKEDLAKATTGIGRQFFRNLLRNWEPILEEFRLELGPLAELDHVPFPGEAIPEPPPLPVELESVPVSIPSVAETRDYVVDFTDIDWTASRKHLHPQDFDHPDIRKVDIWVRKSGTGLLRCFSERDLTGFIADFGDIERQLSRRRVGLYVVNLTVEEVKEIRDI